VDWVTFEAENAGLSAVDYVKTLRKRQPPRRKGKLVKVVAGKGVRYVLPHSIQVKEPQKLYLRVEQPARNVMIQVREGRKIYHKIKKPRVNPPEMVTIKLKPELLLTKKTQKNLVVEVK
jgi:hypothetical protein